jgi:hypothetical protein
VVEWFNNKSSESLLFVPLCVLTPSLITQELWNIVMKMTDDKAAYMLM